MPRKCWAFLVGVNEYLDYAPLRHCVDDVRALERLLDAIGYVPVCLHDRMDPRSEPYPSRNNIETELEILLEKVTEDDLLLVYFACHGVRTADGKPMLVVSETRKRKLGNTAISIVDYLEPTIRASSAKQKVLMLDACFVGTGRGERDPADYLRRVSDLTSGFEILSASTERQEALESSELQHGIFCHFLLKGIAGAAAMQPEAPTVVMLSMLRNYMRAEIDEYTTRNGNFIQIPQHRSEGDAGDFMLADYSRNSPPDLDQVFSSDRNEATTTVSLQGRGISPELEGRSASQIVECLWSLDCEPQCQAVRAGTPRSRRAVAFVVQAKDSRIQHWLVKRLVHQIPNVANARVFPFNVPTHPMGKRGGGVGELWLDLAEKLKCKSEPSAVIEALIQTYQSQPIIVAMYGWSPRLMKLQEQILEQFWRPLIEMVGGMEQQPLRSRCILFLAEGQPITTAIPKSAVAPIRLDPLAAITHEHVQQWMDCDEVYSLLKQFLPDAELSTLIDQEVAGWSTDPASVIEEICYIFELDNGIADIEVEWRLAG